jgi:hypothetical protein
MPENPFNFLLATRPEDFVGRHQLVNEIVGELCSLSGRNSYGLIAGTRAGKSSLLAALESDLIARLKQAELSDLHVIPVRFSLKEVTPTPGQSVTNLNLSDIFGFASHKLRAAVCAPPRPAPFGGRLLDIGLPEYSANNSTPASLQDLEATITEIIAHAYERLGDTRIVLLIDEMDVALGFPWTSLFFGNLRSLIYDSQVKDFVRLALAGSGRFLEAGETGSQLFNAIKACFIDPFSEHGVRELLARAQGIAPEVAQEVMRQGGGHPFIIQHILYYLFQAGMERATVESVSAEVRRFTHDRSADLAGWWNAIGTDGQRVYCILRQFDDWRTIADVMREVNDPGVEADAGLKALCYHGVVTHDGTYNQYRIEGRLFCDWAGARCQAFARNRNAAPHAAIVSRGTAEIPSEHKGDTMMFPNGYGLVIGIANYPRVRKLPTTVLKDAQDVKRILCSPSHCGYPQENVRLLLDSEATADGIRNGLRWLAEISDAGDTAVLFFSGHGGRRKKESGVANYLIPYDCDPTDLDGTAISGDELTGLLRSIEAQRLLALFDSCYSGGTGEAKDYESTGFKSGLSEDYYSHLGQGAGRVVVASSRSDELSLVLHDMENSLFTHYLLEALSGGARTRADGLIRVFDLFDYVSEKVPARAKQHPIFKASDLENNFPVALYEGGKQVALGSSAAMPTTTHVNKRELRESIVKHFNIDELEILCADIEQDLAEDGVALSVNLDIVGGGTSKTSKALKLIEYVENRRYLSYLVSAVRRARPGII